MADISFRQFEKEDTEEVYAVALAAWNYTYKGILDPHFIREFVRQNYGRESLISVLPDVESDRMFFYVAISESKVIGFCNIGDRGYGMELLRIYLLPSFVGKGIGKKLLQLGEEFIISKGLKKYFCFVHKDNQLGKIFYFKNGFSHIAENEHEDDCYFEKTIQQTRSSV